MNFIELSKKRITVRKYSDKAVEKEKLNLMLEAGNTELEKAFELPENEHSVLLMPVGYRVEGTVPFPTHEQKKSLDKIVKYL